jgi:FKBP-type peptidyl-prolyl cis-trans isomerase
MTRMIGFSRARLLAAAAGCALTASAALAVADEHDEALYSLGALMGEQLQELELSDAERERVVSGFRDSLGGSDLEVNPEEHMDALNAFVMERRSQGLERSRADQQAFIEQFVAEEGGTLTESGLAYRIIDEGDEQRPAASDTVEVHYEGRLINGEVFDSSRQRGDTAVFPLDRVIPGWTEGLQLIGRGGRIELVIPSDLAYGDRGSPPAIPGGATLVFDVELIDIE